LCRGYVDAGDVGRGIPVGHFYGPDACPCAQVEDLRTARAEDMVGDGGDEEPVFEQEVVFVVLEVVP
jgi:hypothetical protein